MNLGVNAEWRAKFGHQSPSNQILMKCPWPNPYQMSLEFCLMNPSIILPTARTFRVGAHLGAYLGLLARLLAEKIAFQEAFKKRLNFTSILTSIFVPLGSILRPNLDPKIDQKSIKNRSQDAFHFGFHFSSIFDRIFLPTSTLRTSKITVFLGEKTSLKKKIAFRS